jgi:hypothetical protein
MWYTFQTRQPCLECIFDVNNENKYGGYRGKFGDIWVFRYANNRRIKNILIPSIVWVEENADFLKFISSYFSIIYYILNMYAKFEKCVVNISLISE